LPAAIRLAFVMVGARLVALSLELFMPCGTGKNIIMKSPSGPSENPIRFAGSVLDAQRHVCGFFNSPEDEYKVCFRLSETASHVVSALTMCATPMTEMSISSN
jgi:hypothetical protein